MTIPLTTEQLAKAKLDFWDTGNQLVDHVYRRSAHFFRSLEQRLDQLEDLDALVREQARIRSEFLDLIGGLPQIPDQPESDEMGVVNLDGGRTVRRMMLTGTGGMPISALLYPAPKASTEHPAPAVLFCCGHALPAKAYPEYQRVCQFLQQAGITVLAFDPIGQGERLQFPPDPDSDEVPFWGTREHDFVGNQAQLLGFSLARWFLADCITAFNFLANLPEVDPHRIGVTGNSGGGTQTSLMMLAEPRVAAAAPATFIMSRESYQATGQAQDAEQIWPGFTSRLMDHESILLAMAPKPVRVLAVTYDFFPVEGTRRTVHRAKRYWQIAGNPEGLSLVEDVQLHLYSEKLAKAATSFFAQAFQLPEPDGEQFGFSPVDPKHLNVSPTGQIYRDFRQSPNLFSLLREESERRTSSSSTPSFSLRLWLRKRVFDPALRSTCELRPRLITGHSWEGFPLTMTFWWSQPDLVNSGFLFHPKADSSPEHSRVALFLSPNGTKDLAALKQPILDHLERGIHVMVTNLSGIGQVQVRPINARSFDEPYGTIQKIHDDLVWIGDSLAALRLYDAARAVGILRLWPEGGFHEVHLVSFQWMDYLAHLLHQMDPRIDSFSPSASEVSMHSWIGSREYPFAPAKSLVIPELIH